MSMATDTFKFTTLEPLDLSSTSDLSSTYETYLFTFLAVFSFLFGSLGSLISLLYFTRRFTHKPASSTLLFVLMNLTDATTCFLVLFIGISDLPGHHGLFSSPSVFCDVWGVAWYVAARMSIFLVAVLSISRTYMVLVPLAVVDLWVVLLPSLVYLTLMVLQQTLVFWWGVRYVYEPDSGHCSVDPYELLSQLPVEEDQIGLYMKILFFVFVPLENIAPWIVIVISCVLTISAIRQSCHQQEGLLKRTLRRILPRGFLARRTRAVLTSSAQSHTRKRNATVTVLLLTVTYLIFNTYAIAIFSLDMVEIFSDESIRIYSRISDRNRHALLVLAWVYSVALNSTCNIVVYFVRLPNLRRFAWHLVVFRRIPKDTHPSSSSSSARSVLQVPSASRSIRV